MEKEDGTREPLIDTGSFAAGYRQAIMDLAKPEPEPSLLPVTLAVFALVFLWLKIASLLDAE